MTLTTTTTARRRRRLAALGATVLAGALLAGGQAASAATAETAASDVDVWRVPDRQAAAAEDYWTPERMEAAEPGETLLEDRAPAPPAPAERGTPQRLAAAKPSPARAPVKTIGKVFFTVGGKDYVCSGNSVRSDNESTVATAGHCLNEGPGAYASRFAFAPAYEKGKTPYGLWTPSTLLAPSQWTRSGDLTHDVGFAIMRPLNGKTLADTVGASAIAFNQPRGATYTAYGYPAVAPFTGETLHSCAGKATPDATKQTQSQGIPCDVTPGSSGGPWFLGSGSSGTQNSLNSFRYGDDRMYGPYFGAVAQQVYRAASTSK